MTRLRPLTADDAPAVRRVYSGAALAFLGRAEMGEREAVEYVARAREGAAADPVVQYVLGVEVDGDLVGVAKLGRRPGGHGRVSYVLREDSWGSGHATSAVRDLVSFAFGAGGFTSLGAKHHPANHASGRVLEKSGFTRAGWYGGMVEYRRYRMVVPRR
ncbi:GNAT family N-acetyltransferase [Streptomyces sp. R302]|uniref:GNAT family N-acetyltransferase n=1 Tax=unclassified Streptomyces TaxID=2593676 RepID=UPI00145F43FF|nr:MULTISPECIES: GNAT family N-acetyltransferase [unclassified Streptomyces]NML50055.1 GNAT family N-acetyltransferase [Streptomyces sp. R301]NML79046.1 GNAT family N-acetyltransferase [Streptomyces sp. R302]